MTRFLGPLAAAAASSLLVIALLGLRGVTTARAEGFDTGSCPEHVVIYGMNGYQSNVAFGATNEIYLSDHNFASCLSGNTALAATGATSRLHLGGTTNNWVEIGWMMKNTSSACVTNAGPSHCISTFTEWGLNGTHQNQTLFNPVQNPIPAACVNSSKWNNYDLQGGDTIGTSWSLSEDCEDGAGYRVLKVYRSTGYYNGIPEAESFERGGSDMAGETHRNLQYWDPHWIQRSSTSLTCRGDNDPTFDASIPSGNEMDVINTGSGYTCGSNTF
ncbi:MAG TPA: hypothetical protein VF221_00195 [Chloroflexota bacterium]